MAPLLAITLNLIKLNELVSQGVLGLLIDISSVMDSVLSLIDLGRDLVLLWQVISLAGEGVADFLDLLSDGVTVPKDDDVYASLLGAFALVVVIELLNVHV